MDPFIYLVQKERTFLPLCRSRHTHCRCSCWRQDRKIVITSAFVVCFISDFSFVYFCFKPLKISILLTITIWLEHTGCVSIKTTRSESNKSQAVNFLLLFYFILCVSSPGTKWGSQYKQLIHQNVHLQWDGRVCKVSRPSVGQVLRNPPQNRKRAYSHT